MQKSETIGALMKAVAQIQGHISDVPKNKTVKVTMKSGKTYQFSYSDLEAMRSASRALQKEYGVAFCLIPIMHHDVLKMELLISHESGEWLQATSEHKITGGGEMNSMQAVGSAITYLTRYMLSSFFGFGGCEDDDANSADGNEFTYKNSSNEQAQPAQPAKTNEAPKAEPTKPTKPIELAKPERLKHLRELASKVYDDEELDYKQQQWREMFNVKTLELLPANSAERIIDGLEKKLKEKA